MAPIVRLLDKKEVKEIIRDNKIKDIDECPLKELVQYECELITTSDNSIKYDCNPFKRLFRDCINLRVEVTDENTN